MRPLTADPKHADCGLIQLDEDTVVYLPEPEQLQHLPNLGRDLVDTTNPHDEGQLGLPGHMEVALFLGLPFQSKIKRSH